MSNNENELNHIKGFNVAGKTNLDNEVITIQEAQEALFRWCDAAASGIKESVLDCYANNARLKGTVWDHIVNSPEKRDEYFTHFLSGKHNIRVLLDEESQEIECNGKAVRLKGRYTFCFDDDEGQPQQVPAHYKFSFSKDKNGDVKILGHFSSAVDNFPAEKTLLEQMIEETNGCFGTLKKLSNPNVQIDTDIDQNPV